MERSLGGPLRSWDIFMGGYRRNLAIGKDLVQIGKIATDSKWKTGWDIFIRPYDERKVLLVTDTSFNILFASGNIHHFDGYDPSEITGQNIAAFVPNSDKITIDTKRIFAAEMEYYQKNGKLKPCIVQILPVRNTHDEHTHFFICKRPALKSI